MRARLLAVTAVAAAVGFYLLQLAGGPDNPSSSPESSRAPAPAMAVSQPAAAPSASLRNVFEYADAGVQAAGPPARLAPPPPIAVASAIPAPAPVLVRLVGLLRRGAQVRAALSIAGETHVLASGESAGGYTVVGIDEDEGVRVKTPDGSTIVLAPAGGR
jgi:hypothetical protein